jgi:hypothetical protein
MFSLLKNQILISALIAEIGAATPAKINLRMAAFGLKGARFQ